MSTRSPNLLILMTDQQSHDWMSCVGNRDLRTPAMDALAARGTRFARAYTPFPLCSPMRCAMATGRYPHQMGVLHQGAGATPWKERASPSLSLARLLEPLGHQAVWAGKDQPPPSWGYTPLCGVGDVQVADHLERFLAEADPQRPFLAAGIFQNPHNICEWAMGQPLYEGPIPAEPPLDDLPLLPANHAIAPYEAELIDIFCRGTWHLYHHRYQDKPDFWRRYRWAYARLIERVDRQIGRVLTALERSGRTDDTIILLTSDHGDGAGAHRWPHKSALFEECLRVPFLLSGPGITPGRVEPRHMVNAGLDVLPTLCEIFGLPRPDGIDQDATSLVPQLLGRPADESRRLVIETSLYSEGFMTGRKPLQFSGRAIIQGDSKYACYFLGQHREQLFDLATDPGEMVNRAMAGADHAERDRMRRLLHDFCRRTEDPFLHQVPGHALLSPGADRW